MISLCVVNTEHGEQGRGAQALRREQRAAGRSPRVGRVWTQAYLKTHVVVRGGAADPDARQKKHAQSPGGQDLGTHAGKAI